VTDNITLPRAAVEQVREALEAMQSYAAAERKGLRICDEAVITITAALAEPPATREPATGEQMFAAYNAQASDPQKSTIAFYCDGWRDAERFHGITKEDKT
jgi:hypothetical protein